MSDLDETIAEWRINGLELNEAEKFIERLIEDRKKLRTENEELKEGLTASYMLGSENGKEAAKAEIAELKQDAIRYRWLRDNKHLDIWWSVFGPEDRCKNIDQDIDTAMSEEAQQ